MKHLLITQIELVSMDDQQDLFINTDANGKCICIKQVMVVDEMGNERAARFTKELIQKLKSLKIEI